MCLGVICAREVMWVAVPGVMYAASSAMNWDTMHVSVPRICLGNPQCKGRVLLDREELADLQLLREQLGLEVKSVGLHKFRRDLQNRQVQLEMFNRPECMQ